MKFFCLYIFGLLSFCISFDSSFAQFTNVNKDTNLVFTYSKLQTTLSNQNHVLAYNTSDIVVPEERTLWITSNGGKSWSQKEFPEGFQVIKRNGNLRLYNRAVRPSKSTLFLLCNRQVGETIIIKEGPGINPMDPTTWKFLAEIETAIITTFDLGNSWQIQQRMKDTVDTKFNQNTMTFGLRDSLVCAVFLNRDSLLLTLDGGLTWQVRTLTNQPALDRSPLQVLYTKNSSQIIVNYNGVGEVTFGDLSGTGGQYILSNDNGLTWEKRSLPRGGVLHITEMNTWYLFHESSILNNGKSEVFFSKSTDEGKTWETVFTQSWPQGRGGERASSIGKTLAIATRGSFSPLMGQLLPISYDEGLTWNYPEFPDSLFGTVDQSGGVATGGIAVPLSGFSDIQLVEDGIVGLAGEGSVLVIGKFKKDLTTSISNSELNDFLSISPNPSSNSIVVRYALPLGEQTAMVTIVDALGVEAVKIPLENNRNGSINIKTQSLANGTYHLRITKGSFATSQLLIVHK